MLQRTPQRTIVWYDPTQLGPSHFKQSLVDKGWLLRTVDNFSSASTLLQQNTTAVLLLFVNGIKDESLKLFNSKLGINFDSSTVLISSSADDDLLLSSINDFKVTKYLELPFNEDAFLKTVETAYTNYIERSERKLLVKQFNTSNKKLEELTQGQEKIIQERIFSTESSKLEAESKQKKIKNLINFVHEISTIENVEDFLSMIRRVFRKLPHVGEVFIGYSASLSKNTILLMEKGQIVHKTVSTRWPSFSGVQISSKEVRQFLANEIRRPFAKLLCFNLQQRVADQNASSVLFIEHSASDEEVRQMLEFVMERMQPMSIALDRVLLSERWRSTSELWEKTFDALNEPLCIIDLEYNLLRSNSYFGPHKKKCYESFKGQNKICDGCPVDLALKSKSFAKSEVKRGSKVFDVHSYPILFSGDKKITTVVNYYVDITEHQKLYSKLVQSEKMAALGSMAGHIAHELNNPLTGIRSLAQILSDDERVSTQHRSDLKEIEKAAARSQLIIKNLLEFTNPAHEEDLSVVPMGLLVEKTLPMIKTALRFHSTEINNQLQDDFVKVNANLVQQVIFNIVNNSCQAMLEPGEISISVSIQDDRVLCRIQDNGPGIPPELREKVFEPFFTTKKEGEGTGLGLSVSRSIIEKFEGHLYIEDSAVGASFVIQLPRYNSDGRKYENLDH